MTDFSILKPWVITTTRIPYGHTDQMAHVYYGTYLLYFEMGRNEWMRAAGLTYKSFEEMGYIVPVVEAHAKYRGRIFYDDIIEIRTAVRLEGRSRIKFFYEIRREGEPELLTTGWSLHAVTNSEGRPTRIPQVLHEIAARIGQYENE